MSFSRFAFLSQKLQFTYRQLSIVWLPRQARSRGGGGRWGQSPPKKLPPAKKKRGGGERERKKENKVVCMHVKLPPFNHFQSKIKYKFVLYVENTGHMHQIAPSKCKKALTVGGGTPLARSARSGSVASLPRTLFIPPAIKLNPGYATVPRV